MKKTLILVLTLCIYSIAAQTTPTTLAISGKSNINVTPDITVISVNLNSLHKDYNTAIVSLDKKAKEFKSILANEGLEKEQINSENFNIDKRYDYKNNTRVFIGYDARLWLQIEFENDNAFANKIINALGTSETEAEVSVSFKISNTRKDSLNDQLIELAIADAQQKAQVITKATNQQLEKILKINYGVQDKVTPYATLNYSSAEMRSRNKSNNTNFSITPKDITLSTDIVIFWITSAK